MNDDLTIIPPSDDFKLDWTVREYLGYEIFHYTEDDKAELVPILKDELKVGDKFFTPSLIGGYIVGTVTELNGDTGFGESGQVGCSLEFGKDDRNCWVCGCQINLSGLDKIDFG